MKYDVAVIGGGAIGAGIARDAALRGLSVILFEKNDLAAGTSSRSTRLIHGGLRYLETLDFALVRQDLQEREILLRIAPHLVKPLPFLIPFYERIPLFQAKVRAGMALYDTLSYDKSLPHHRLLSASEAKKQEPSLRAEGLQGAAMYWDAQVSLAERLVLENALDARDHGTVLKTHTQVTGLIREKMAKRRERVTGVIWKDLLTEETGETQAHLVINASGPWLDETESEFATKSSSHLRLTKGIHFTAPPLRGNQTALVLFTEQDHRLFFVVPWLGFAWVGTTDTDFEGDLDTVHASAGDVDYLRRAVRPFLPETDWETVYYTNAGVRALVRRQGVTESEVSRQHTFVDYAETADKLDGLLSVVGGKLTGYRAIAEETVDIACRKLGRALTALPCRTAQTPLPGSEGRYAPPVLPAPGVSYDLNQVRASAERAVTEEECRTLCDFMLRRSLLFLTSDQGQEAMPTALETLASLLSWDSERAAAERKAYETQVALTQAFRVF